MTRSMSMVVRSYVLVSVCLVRDIRYTKDRAQHLISKSTDEVCKALWNDDRARRIEDLHLIDISENVGGLIETRSGKSLNTWPKSNNQDARS